MPNKRIIRTLWIGLLVPPVAFLLNLEAAYALVPTACSEGTAALVHLVHLISLLLAVFGGVVAWRAWQQSGATWPGGAGGRVSRTQFLAGLGALMGLLFIVVILAQWMPSFILDPCQ
ncbi:MAG TPA: hypothetical protein VFH24_01120 [Gemmatimonadales bacterium]|nr:hypothetical protein [Gemmatimonadales bacterium]